MDAHVQIIFIVIWDTTILLYAWKNGHSFSHGQEMYVSICYYWFLSFLLGFGATMKETLPLQLVASSGINLGTFKLLYNLVGWVVFLLFLSGSSCPLPG